MPLTSLWDQLTKSATADSTTQRIENNMKTKKISQQVLRQPEARPDAGARGCGKPNAPREGNGYHCGRKLPKSEAVREVEPDKNAGACIKALTKQINGIDGVPNGNPKVREFVGDEGALTQK